MRLGLYLEHEQPELNGSGLLVKNDKTEQPLREGVDTGYSLEGSFKSGVGDALDDTVVIYNVPPWLEDE